MHLRQLNRNCDVEQPAFPFLNVLCPMCEQTTPEHSRQTHERPALASGAFVTLAAADALASQAEDCIPERKNCCVRMVSRSDDHKHQPLSLRCGQLYSTSIQLHSRSVSCQNHRYLSQLRTFRNCRRNIAIALIDGGQLLVAEMACGCLQQLTCSDNGIQSFVVGEPESLPIYRQVDLFHFLNFRDHNRM